VDYIVSSIDCSVEALGVVQISLEQFKLVEQISVGVHDWLELGLVVFVSHGSPDIELSASEELLADLGAKEACNTSNDDCLFRAFHSKYLN
jgi:hypothetical protein